MSTSLASEIFNHQSVKLFLFIAAILIAANAFAGLEDKGLHAPSAQAAYSNSARYLHALGQIESGGDDTAHGKRGEISRYQCLKKYWHGAPISAATNPAVAASVTLAVIRERTGKDAGELTPAQFALAWHCPAKLHSGKLTKEQSDYVARFENLAL